ncbi:YciI family protein [Phytohabitans kaempferiae]|uniref:YciI family protein n=1 Tax=Phytohabitans kaempferiae TaxID=1620943 RepID=A0ABV6LX83_9ACTN
MWIVELSLAPTAERLQARSAHRRLLASLCERGVVRMAGPLADDSGAVVVFDVPGRDDVERLLKRDPYLATPGVAVASVREWRPFTPVTS